MSDGIDEVSSRFFEMWGVWSWGKTGVVGRVRVDLGVGLHASMVAGDRRDVETRECSRLAWAEYVAGLRALRLVPVGLDCQTWFYCN